MVSGHFQSTAWPGYSRKGGGAETETTYRRPGQPGSKALVSENCQQITDKDGLFEKDEQYVRDSNGLLKQIKTYINGDLMTVTRFIYRFY